MAIITAIEPQKNDAERVSLFLDGAFAFGLPTIVVLAHRLTTGVELSEADIAALRTDDTAERSYGAALNFLSFRQRSRREIEQYLRGRAVEQEVIEAVVERLERSGLLNDGEFARAWVENRQTFKPRGRRALRAELRQKGLDAETVESALTDLGDEEETAVEAGRKKAATLSAREKADFNQRMVGFLQRRGFGYAVAAAAAERLWMEVNEDAIGDG